MFGAYWPAAGDGGVGIPYWVAGIEEGVGGRAVLGT